MVPIPLLEGAGVRARGKASGVVEEDKYGAEKRRVASLSSNGSQVTVTERIFEYAKQVTKSPQKGPKNPIFARTTHRRVSASNTKTISRFDVTGGRYSTDSGKKNQLLDPCSTKTHLGHTRHLPEIRNTQVREKYECPGKNLKGVLTQEK
ncbi:hypothetical protein C8R45DRAFT_1074029 [Mycena sanguinolenta]|nr:hypothetical protein C8R45DRAFT_1074029 [Mycena sanguinolenta]